MSLHLEHCDWKCTSDVYFGTDNEIHVWKIPLLEVNERDFTSLSSEEKLRLSSYRNEQSRTIFYSSRIAMRKLFSTYLHILPEAVNFATREHGKPYLELHNNTTKFEFNLTHSGEQILLAISTQQSVGIDIEAMRTVPNWQRVAKKVFDNNLMKRLLNTANPANEFVKLWTEFEARQKLAGMGVFGSHQQIPGNATIINWQPAPGYHAALAFQTDESIPSICFFEFDTSESG